MDRILLDFFPVVLNRIILEYTIPIEHEFHVKYTAKCVHCALTYDKCCVIDNCVYKYIDGLLTLEMVTKNDMTDLIYTSDEMVEYKNNIYVAVSQYVHVYDKKCRMIDKLECSGIICDILKITNDKIFIGQAGKPIVQIIDLLGNFFKKIVLPARLYDIQIYDEFVYILTFDEVIYIYSKDGDIVDEYNYKNMLDSIKIKFFIVIDSTIYVYLIQHNAFFTTKISKYGKQYIEEITIRCVNIENYDSLIKIVVKNNILYTITSGRYFCMYTITKKLISNIV